MSLPTLDEVRQDFEELETMDERYKFLLELGLPLRRFSPEEKTERNEVQGCQAKVWLVIDKPEDPNLPVKIEADSDAEYVRGVIALLLIVYAGKTAAEAAAFPMEKFFRDLKLEKMISPSRTNGLFSMVRRVRDLTKISAS